MAKKVLRVVNELAKEVYGDNVFVDAVDYGPEFDQYIDIYSDAQQEYPRLSIINKNAFQIMIELLRIVKKMNKVEVDKT